MTPLSQRSQTNPAELGVREFHPQRSSLKAFLLPDTREAAARCSEQVCQEWGSLPRTPVAMLKKSLTKFLPSFRKQ